MPAIYCWMYRRRAHKTEGIHTYPWGAIVGTRYLVRTCYDCNRYRYVILLLIAASIRRLLSILLLFIVLYLCTYLAGNLELGTRLSVVRSAGGVVHPFPVCESFPYYYELGRPRNPGVTNIATHRSIFVVRT